MSEETKFVEEVTAEQAAKSVLAAYDSVALIAELKAKPELTEEETDAIGRNEEHLRIMLAKEWFAEALTPEQKTELEALV
jgi:hypothetical protein